MKETLKWIFLFCVVILATSNQNIDVTPSSEWKSIFNGKDLTGWIPKINGYEAGDNYASTFRVENGALVVRYDQYTDGLNNRFGHIFYEELLSYYHIKFQYRFIGEQIEGGPEWAFKNSGIMLHCQSVESMGKNQNFPISIEAQLLGGNGVDERPTMNLCTPGTNVVMNGELVTTHCLTSDSQTYHGEQWITAEAIVRGSEEIIHIVEGDTVMVYQNPQLGGGSVSGHDESLLVDGKLLSEGYISFQSESHPVEFRNIMVKELPH